MAYGDFKDLNRRTAADKVFNIARNPKHDRYQRSLALIVLFFFSIKKSFR